MAKTGTGVFSKVFLHNDLYNTTEAEMKELENWKSDPSVRRDTKRVFRPLFNNIQKEKAEAREFNGNVVIRLVGRKDYAGLILLSKRVCHTGKHTGIIRFNEEAIEVRMNEGVTFVATTESGFVVGLSSILIGEVDGAKCGYEFLIMVSRLFQRKGIAEKLFDHTIRWSRENNLTHINATPFSDEGYKFAQSQCNLRQDIECSLNRFGVSSFNLK